MFILFWLIGIFVLGILAPTGAEEQTGSLQTSSQYYVIKVNGEVIYTNIGEQDSAISPGSIVRVYRETKKIIDPTSKRILREIPIVFGSLQVTEVMEKYSIGKVVESKS